MFRNARMTTFWIRRAYTSRNKLESKRKNIGNIRTWSSTPSSKAITAIVFSSSVVSGLWQYGDDRYAKSLVLNFTNSKEAIDAGNYHALFASSLLYTDKTSFLINNAALVYVGDMFRPSRLLVMYAGTSFASAVASHMYQYMNCGSSNTSMWKRREALYISGPVMGLSLLPGLCLARVRAIKKAVWISVPIVVDMVLFYNENYLDSFERLGSMLFALGAWFIIRRKVMI